MSKESLKMKDSGVEWIGEIPEGWEVVPLKKLFKSRKKQVGSRSEDYMLLRLSKEGVFPKNEDDSGKNPANYETYQAFEPDDLVFCTFDYDVTPRTIGLVTEPGMLTGAYTRLIPKIRNEIVSKYYYYYYFALDTDKVLLHLCTGLRNGLGSHVFWKLPNPHPPRETQQKIVDFLDRKTMEVDALIEKKKRMIGLLKEKRTSIITHAVTKGLDPHVKMKDSGVEWIGEIPEGWDVKRVRFIFNEISDRNHPDAELLSVYREYGVIPTASRDDNHNVPSEDLSSYKYVREGDLVFNKMKTWQGSIAISNYEGIVSPAYYVAEFKNKTHFDLNYIHYLLRSRLYISKYKSISTGIRPGQWDMSFDAFKDVHVLIPDVDEQKSIAKYVYSKIHQTDTLLEALSNQIKKLTEYRNSLIYHAVTGKMSV